MKRTKKLWAVLLSMLMLLGVFTPTVLAANDEDTEVVIYVKKPERFAVPVVSGDTTQSVQWDELFDYLEVCVENTVETIDISEFNIPNTTANFDTIINFFYYSPLVFGAVEVKKYSINKNILTGFGVTYNYTSEQIKTMKQDTEDAMISLLYGIKDNDNLTDAQKCLLLHDRLAAYCEYDYDNYKAKTIPDISFTAYGALVLRVAVCQGIALAYEWMLDKMGIECYYTTSEVLGHGWNMVCIDTEPYYLDVTHDDPSYDIIGRVEHNYVLVSFSSYSAAHKNASDFSNQPTSTVYENAFWTKDTLRTAEIQYVNGKFYYLDVQTSGTASLIEVDPATGTETSLKDISDKWWVSESSYYLGKYTTYLTSVGSKLYYNTADEIRSYDTLTGEDELVLAPDLSDYDEYTNIYGLTQKDGVLYYLVSTQFYVSDENRGTILTYNICTDHTSRDELEVITAPTCSQAGESKYICKDCRAVFTATVPSTNAHSYTQLVSTKTPATCTANAYGTYKCAYCNSTTDREIANTKTGHHYDTFVSTKTAAGCTTDRVDTYKCSCGDTKDKTIANTRTGHHYNTFVSTKTAAGCTTDRVDTYKCSCGDTKDITAANTRTGHSDADDNGLCDVCGENLRAGCKCSCHKTGISNTFFKIKIFFSKLFGIEKNRYCECGAAHW